MQKIALLTLVELTVRTRALGRVVLALSLLLKTASALAALPAGWISEDIGTPAKSGQGNIVSGLWSVTGGGADIWNNADQFQMTHTNLNSDGIVTAQVLSQSSSNSFAQAGVMIRSSNSSGATEASVSITPASVVTFRYRLSA